MYSPILQHIATTSQETTTKVDINSKSVEPTSTALRKASTTAIRITR
jgi:hypothetical protein